MSPVASLLHCRKAKPTPDQIVGGEEVRAGDPDQKFVTLLRIRRDYHESVCTGTLIGDKIVLTAAHCVSGVEPHHVSAFFETSSGCPLHHVRNQSLEVQSIALHESFDGTPQSLADLALLKLEEKAPREQQRLPLLTEAKKPTRDTALLLGFGVTGETRSDSMTLRRISKSLKNEFVFRDSSVLIDQQNGKGGFCRGDSGSPVLVEVWGEPHILAVNSANIGIRPGTECQTASLAIDVRHHEKWIRQKMLELDPPNIFMQLFSKLFGS